MLIKQHSILSSVYLYGLHDNTLLQCNEVKNGSLAFGIPLAFTGLPVNSRLLSLYRSRASRCSVLTLGDGFTFVSTDILTTKLVPDEPVYFFALRANYLRGSMSLEKGWAD